MANPSEARDFLINSDYPLDKVIYMKSGSFVVPGMGFANETVAHGLPFTPLLCGSWSTTSDFSISYDMYVGTFPPSFNTQLYATSTNMVIDASSQQASAATLYYRVFGLMPSTVNQAAPFTASQADDFVLNSDYNYSKLYLAGTVSGTTTITHSLGFKPQILAWREYNSRIDPHVYTGVNDTFNTYLVKVTDTDMQITYVNPSQTSTMHYRLYADE